MDKRKRADTVSDENAESGWDRAGPGFHAPTELVTFIVGQNGHEEPFKVHKEHICYYSPALNAAFNNPRFTEGETQTYRLDDIRPSAFRLFVQWIYTQNFDSFAPSIKKPETISRELCTRLIEQDSDLIQLWVLGDKFLIPGLQNRVVDSLTRNLMLTKLYNNSWFQYAYAHTAEGSPLRRYAVDYAVARKADYKRSREKYPVDMLFDLLEKMDGEREEGVQFLIGEDYHVVDFNKEEKKRKKEDVPLKEDEAGGPAEYDFFGLENLSEPVRSGSF